MTFGLWPSGIFGYITSQPGEATPPRTSIPCRAVSLHAMPIVSNHSSCIRNKLVDVSLFRRAWVTAFLFCMFTDTMMIDGCTAIKEGVSQQHQIEGAKVTLALTTQAWPYRFCQEMTPFIAHDGGPCMCYQCFS